MHSSAPHVMHHGSRSMSRTTRLWCHPYASRASAYIPARPPLAGYRNSYTRLASKPEASTESDYTEHALLDIVSETLCQWPLHITPTVFIVEHPEQSDDPGPGQVPNPAPPPRLQPPQTHLPSPPPSPGVTSGYRLLVSADEAMAYRADVQNFVKSVVKRTYSSIDVLRLALFYTEVIRRRIAGGYGDFGLDSAYNESYQKERIVLASDIDHTEEDCGEQEESPSSANHSCDVSIESYYSTTPSPSPQAEPLTLPTQLPSPLLDPRRTFVAALLVATKFLNDKNYSNRAWARLFALPPREIGCWERTLVHSLGWRLWIRKTPSDLRKAPSLSRVSAGPIFGPSIFGISSMNSGLHYSIQDLGRCINPSVSTTRLPIIHAE